MSTQLVQQSVSTAARRKLEAAESPAFCRSVAAVMDKVEYRRCESGEDLEDIYRLRYNSYLAAGMIRPDASRAVRDEFDELPNSYRYGIYYEGELVSTLRLHHVTAAYPYSPSVKVFRDALEPRLASGESFVDPSRFAADSEWAKRLRVLPYVTLRIALIACRHFKPSACLTAVKEEHASFYYRVFRADPIVKGRIYPGLTMPVDLYQARCPMSPDQGEERFPFFRSTLAERRMLFWKPGDGALAPLTILPTARYIREAA